jgi:hypothetical protein
MYITKKFIELAGGPRSPLVRSAMVQAGDKHRVEALKKFLLSVGSCEITYDDIRALGLDVREKTYPFCGQALVYVLLDPETFARFRPLTNEVDLEVARVRNGVIGIRYRDTKGQSLSK